MAENNAEAKPVTSKVEILDRNPVAVGIILDPLERILLQKKDGGYPWLPNKWAFAGGAIENGEDAKEAYIREMEEELGIKQDNIQLFGVWQMRDHNEIDNRIRVYDAHVFSSRFDGDLSKIKIKEGNGIALFTISEIDSHPVYWGCKHIIEKFYLSLLEKRS